MFCTKCGNPIDPNARFCNNCGEKIEKTESNTVVSNNNVNNNRNDKKLKTGLIIFVSVAGLIIILGMFF